MAERKYYRSINFDLRIEALEIYYSDAHPKQAYKDIKKYLISNGFTHRQWSGYKSKTKLDDYDIISFVNKMFNEFPWLEDCATRFDVTNIGKTYDILSMRLADKKPEKAQNPRKRQSAVADIAAEPEPKPDVQGQSAQHTKRRIHR